MQKKTRNGHEGKQASSVVELSKWLTDEEGTGVESNFQSASDLRGSGEKKLGKPGNEIKFGKSAKNRKSTNGGQDETFFRRRETWRVEKLSFRYFTCSKGHPVPQLKYLGQFN